MRIQILDAAERDLIEGFRFYEAQSSGLGQFSQGFVEEKLMVKPLSLRDFGLLSLNKFVTIIPVRVGS